MSVLEGLFLLVIFLANIVQSITGFAGTVLAMPFALTLVGAEVAKPVLNLSALLLCLYIAIRDHKSIAWKELGKMLLFVGAGFGVGFAVELAPIDGKLLLKLYGLSIVFLALFFLAEPYRKKALPTPVLYLFLFFGGILHKLYVSGGPLVVVYALSRLPDKASFRSTLSLMWVGLNSLLFAQHLSQGLFTPRVWLLFLVAALLSVISYVIGRFLFHKIALPAFMKLTYGLLFLSGFSLL